MLVSSSCSSLVLDLFALLFEDEEENAPNIYNLRSDPFERGPESFEYGKWMADRAFLIVPSQAVVGKWLESFKEYPIRQKPASFNLDGVMEKLTAPPAGK